MCQKLSQVVRPEGAEAPSPGQRPGCNTSKAKRPVRAEALIMNAFALTGRIIIISVYPGRCPGLGAIWAFSPHCLSFDTPSNLSQALIIPVIYSTSRYLG